MTTNNSPLPKIVAGSPTGFTTSSQGFSQFGKGWSRQLMSHGQVARVRDRRSQGTQCQCVPRVTGRGCLVSGHTSLSRELGGGTAHSHQDCPACLSRAQTHKAPPCSRHSESGAGRPEGLNPAPMQGHLLTCHPQGCQLLLEIAP